MFLTWERLCVMYRGFDYEEFDSLHPGNCAGVIVAFTVRVSEAFPNPIDFLRSR